MSPLRLVRTGEVSAKPGDGLPADAADKTRVATKGEWKAGPIAEVPRAAMRVGSRAVLAEASCTFSFAGTCPDPKSAGATLPVVNSSKVSLAPTPSLLRRGGALLRDTATAADTFGNRLIVAPTGPLRSD